MHEACQESLSLWRQTVLFLATCYQPLKQFVSESIIVDAPSVNAVKKHVELLAATKEDAGSWTLSPHEPFWLLVHARYDLTFVVRYVIIAIGAATPGEPRFLAHHV